MSNSSGNSDETVECPLCMEPLEVDDLNFFPCTCGYQICRFCWHRIRTDENELCPACRKEYPENPADFKPLSQEEMIAFKFQKRQRDQQRKQKVTENRKHLANVRVVQKNLVFVVGLPPRLADADILRKHEYFSKYGKIHKVVINPSTTYAGVQGPSASAYVTYVQNADALRAIQSVNNIMIDGRLIKTSLGTTKYCSHFMKNQQCPKTDCMYLHELGDPEASFTKEEMHQGKHQDYEKRLHDLLNAATNITSSNAHISEDCSGISNTVSKNVNKISGTILANSGINAADRSVSPITATANEQKDAWPSLSLSPNCQKEPLSCGANKRMKERYRQDKTKNEKFTKTKIKTVVSQHSDTTTADFKDEEIDTDSDKLILTDFTTENSKTDKINKEKSLTSGPPKKENEEFDSSQNNVQFLPTEMFTKSSESKDKSPLCDGKSLEIAENLLLLTDSLNTDLKPDICTKSTLEDHTPSEDYTNIFNENNGVNEAASSISLVPARNLLKATLSINRNSGVDFVKPELSSDMFTDPYTFSEQRALKSYNMGNIRNESQQDIMKLNKKHGDANAQHQASGRNVPNLPDLITGIEGFKNNSLSIAADWENAPDNFLLKEPGQMDKEFQTQNSQYELEETQHMRHLNELRRVQEIQRRNAFSNLSGPSQIALPRNDTDISRYPFYMEPQTELLQQQKPVERSMQNVLNETNMSKFFDFHKHQQQKLQMQNVHNVANSISGELCENYHMMSLLENKLQMQQIDHISPVPSQPQHFQNQQKFGGKPEQMMFYHQHPHNMSSNSVTGVHHGQLANRYTLQSNTDDDLGFDPFLETQKALAELIENEEQHNAMRAPQNKLGVQTQLNQQQGAIDQVSDVVQGVRNTQAGFNHVNNCSGYNTSQKLQINSKILPFINVPSNSMEACGHPAHQHQITSNVWGSYAGNAQQFTSTPDMRREQFNHRPNHQKGYSGGDWTAMDPAILSFRQFSFHHPNQIGSQPQQPEHEMFLQQLAQHQQLAGFGQEANSALSSNPHSHTQVDANVQGMLEYLKNRQRK